MSDCFQIYLFIIIQLILSQIGVFLHIYPSVIIEMVLSQRWHCSNSLTRTLTQCRCIHYLSKWCWYQFNCLIVLNVWSHRRRPDGSAFWGKIVWLERIICNTVYNIDNEDSHLQSSHWTKISLSIVFQWTAAFLCQGIDCRLEPSKHFIWRRLRANAGQYWAVIGPMSNVGWGRNGWGKWEVALTVT